MKLKKCEACSVEMSPQASSCPKCGHPNKPSSGNISTGTGFLWIIIATVVMVWMLQDDDPPPKTKAQRIAAAETAEKKNATCRKTLKCWGEKHIINASVDCESAIERLALNSSKWTDSWAEQKFTHYRWKSQADGYMTYIGDRIQFQNGFGAMVNHIYECDYDPAHKKVLNARATPGRLPAS